MSLSKSAKTPQGEMRTHTLCILLAFCLMFLFFLFFSLSPSSSFGGGCGYTEKLKKERMYNAPGLSMLQLPRKENLQYIKQPAQQPFFTVEKLTGSGYITPIQRFGQVDHVKENFNVESPFVGNLNQVNEHFSNKDSRVNPFTGKLKTVDKNFNDKSPFIPKLESKKVKERFSGEDLKSNPFIGKLNPVKENFNVESPFVGNLPSKQVKERFSGEDLKSNPFIGSVKN